MRNCQRRSEVTQLTHQGTRFTKRRIVGCARKMHRGSSNRSWLWLRFSASFFGPRIDRLGWVANFCLFVSLQGNCLTRSWRLSASSNRNAVSSYSSMARLIILTTSSRSGLSRDFHQLKILRSYPWRQGPVSTAFNQVASMGDHTMSGFITLFIHFAIFVKLI